MTVTADRPAKDPPAADAPAADMVCCKTGLACLFRLGAQNGVYAEIGAVRRRNLARRRHRAGGAARSSSPASSVCAPNARGSIGTACARPRSATRSCCCSRKQRRRPDGHAARRAGGGRGLRPAVSRRRTFLCRAREAGAGMAGRRADVDPVAAEPADAHSGFPGSPTKLFAERRLMRDVVAAALTHASDRALGADLFSAARRQGDAEPGLLDPLRAHRRGRRVDPVRRRVQLFAQLSACLHHPQARPPGRHEHDRPSVAAADRLFPRQSFRRRRLSAAGGQQRPRFSGEPAVQHGPRLSRRHHLSAGIADLFLVFDIDRARRVRRRRL